VVDFSASIAEFAVRQAERAAQTDIEIQHLKGVIVPALQTTGIARVEIRFDGCGDSGAVEECVCYNVAGAAVPCPAEAHHEAEHPTLAGALKSLTYLALERHYPGWEINDGAYGALMIEAAKANVILDCSLRFTATDDHSTEL
jgi:hypothetical protein